MFSNSKEELLPVPSVGTRRGADTLEECGRPVDERGKGAREKSERELSTGGDEEEKDTVDRGSSLAN